MAAAAAGFGLYRAISIQSSSCRFWGRSLLQETVLRLEGLADVGAPVVVSNAEYRFLIAEQMREIGRFPCPLLLEPVGRNTAPALTLAALRILASGADGMLLAMPADHAMSDAARFRSRAQEVKDLVSRLKAMARSEYTTPSRVWRPRASTRAWMAGRVSRSSASW